jgi:hypothetical protein
MITDRPGDSREEQHAPWCDWVRFPLGSFSKATRLAGRLIVVPIR